MTDKDNIRIFKFMFEATVGKLSLTVKFPCLIKVLWKRSGEVAQIEPTALENGSINFNRKLNLNVNMYFDIVTKQFLEKKSVFSLILVTPKGQKSAGAITIDLATKLNEQVEAYSNVYTLEKCPVSGSSLEIGICSNMLAEKALDSMSQITTANQTAMDTSGILDTSAVGEVSTLSAYGRTQDQYAESQVHEQKSSTSTHQTADLLNFEASNMTDSILKINDTTAKISQFVGQIGASLRVELEKLRESNKTLGQQLLEERQGKEALEKQLSKVKLEHQNAKSHISIIAEEHQKNLEESQLEKSQLHDKLMSAEKMKSSLETASMSGDEEKLQYINALKQQHEEDSQHFEAQKLRLQSLLKVEQEQVISLKTTGSELANQLRATKQALEQVSAVKRQLESQRKDNEQEVQAARIRLEKVYLEMISALNLQGNSNEL